MPTPSHDHSRHLAQPPRTPEEIAAEQEQAEICHDLLLEAAGDDDELVRYLDTLDRSIETPEMIAKHWGVEVKAMYVIENRLRKRVKSLVTSRLMNAPAEKVIR